MTQVYRNYTIDECIETVGPLVLERGATFYMKFTCAKCWSRQTCEEPNKFFEVARCERCGHFTDIKVTGCNYALSLPINQERKNVMGNKIGPKEAALKAQREDNLDVPDFLKRNETPEQAEARRKKHKPRDSTGGMKVIEPTIMPEKIRKAIEKDFKSDERELVTQEVVGSFLEDAKKKRPRAHAALADLPNTLVPAIREESEDAKKKETEETFACPCKSDGGKREAEPTRNQDNISGEHREESNKGDCCKAEQEGKDQQRIEAQEQWRCGQGVH